MACNIPGVWGVTCLEGTLLCLGTAMINALLWSGESEWRVLWNSQVLNHRCFPSDY